MLSEYCSISASRGGTRWGNGASREVFPLDDTAPRKSSKLVWVIRSRRPLRIPDEYANREWHRDLIELSGRKLVSLAESIGATSPLRKPPAAVKGLLAVGAQQGHIKKELMRDSLAAKIQWPE